MRRTLIGLLLVLGPQLWAVEPPRERERWIGVTVDEFTIVGNGSEREVRDVAANLVRLRDALSLVTRLKVRSPLPTKVYVFHDERSFAPYRDAAMGRPSEHTGGVFLPRRDGNYVVLHTGGPASSRRIINHELIHHFVRNTLGSLPVWLNEGLAEFYSTFESDGVMASVGRPREDHILLLRKESMMPLAELFAIDEKSPAYHEGNRRGLFYAQSWLLTHNLLIGDPVRADGLGVFLKRLAADKSSSEALGEAYGVTEQDLERELRAYLRRQTLQYVRFSVSELKSADAAVPAPLTRDSVLALLGDLLGHCGREYLPDAKSFLDASLTLNGRNATATSALAYVYTVEGKRSEADALYQRAVDLGVKEWLPYALIGDSILDGGTAEEELAKARALYAKAVALNPDAAHAYAGLGATYVASSLDVRPGIAALEKSLQLDAEQFETMTNLAVLYARAGRRADAMRLIDGGLAGNHEQQTRAREAVLATDAQHAIERFNQTHAQEAIDELRAIGQQTTNGELRSQIELSLATLRDNDTRQQQLRDFSRAVFLATNRKYTEALRIADALLPNIEDAELAAKVREFRKAVSEAMKRSGMH